jgi:putative ABC transport system substrate-binding protein
LQLRYLRRLLPELSYLLVCVNRERKLVLKAEIEPLVMACREVGIAVELVEIAGPEGVADQLRASAPRALAKIKAGESAAWWVSSSTALHDHVAVLQELADLPVLSENPALVCGATHGKASAMAAIGLDRRNNAHVAAGYAIRILRQEAAAGDFPLGVYDPPDIAINVERFRHHGLRVPFDLLEAATLVYDAEGHFVALPGAESR